MCNEGIHSNRFPGENTLRFESHQFSSRSNNIEIKNQTTTSFANSLSVANLALDQTTEEAPHKWKQSPSKNNGQEAFHRSRPQRGDQRSSNLIEMKVYSHRKRNEEYSDSNTVQKPSK